MAYSAAARTHKPGSTTGHVEPLTSFHGAYSVGGPAAGTAACTNKPGILVLTLTFFSIAAMALQVMVSLAVTNECPLNSFRSSGMAYSAAACTHKPGSNAGHVEPLTSFHGAYCVGGPAAGTAACTNKPGILVLTLTFFSIASMALQVMVSLAVTNECPLNSFQELWHGLQRCCLYSQAWQQCW